MQKYAVLSLLFFLVSVVDAQAESFSFSCQRFKSNCTGSECDKLVTALQKDTARQIFTVKKTEIVDYRIDSTGAVETLRGEQADYSADRQLVIYYKFVTNEFGKITMKNYEPKGATKEIAQIEPTSGFYMYYLMHTDGSIKDVPIGQPYTAYFGWCQNPNAPIKTPAATPAAPPSDSPQP